MGYVVSAPMGMEHICNGCVNQILCTAQKQMFYQTPTRKNIRQPIGKISVGARGRKLRKQVLPECTHILSGYGKFPGENRRAGGNAFLKIFIGENRIFLQKGTDKGKSESSGRTGIQKTVGHGIKGKAEGRLLVIFRRMDLHTLENLPYTSFQFLKTRDGLL